MIKRGATCRGWNDPCVFCLLLLEGTPLPDRRFFDQSANGSDLFVAGLLGAVFAVMTVVAGAMLVTSDVPPPEFIPIVFLCGALVGVLVAHLRARNE